jgi:hypothetical protein
VGDFVTQEYNNRADQMNDHESVFTRALFAAQFVDHVRVIDYDWFHAKVLDYVSDEERVVRLVHMAKSHMEKYNVNHRRKGLITHALYNAITVCILPQILVRKKDIVNVTVKKHITDVAKILHDDRNFEQELGLNIYTEWQTNSVIYLQQFSVMCYYRALANRTHTIVFDSLFAYVQRHVNLEQEDVIELQMSRDHAYHLDIRLCISFMHMVCLANKGSQVVNQLIKVAPFLYDKLDHILTKVRNITEVVGEDSARLILLGKLIEKAKVFLIRVHSVIQRRDFQNPDFEQQIALSKTCVDDIIAVRDTLSDGVYGEAQDIVAAIDELLVIATNF